MSDHCPPGETAAYLRDLDADRHFVRLGRDEKLRHLERCLRFGAAAAADVAGRYGPPGGHVREIVLAHGLRVRETKDDGRLPFLAEYLPRGKTIELFTTRIAETEAALARVRPDFFAAARLSDLCLAHELFHHLEWRRFGATGRLVSLRRSLFGLIPVVHHVAAASEAAAHMFVKAWFGLDFTPHLFKETLERLRQ